MGMQQMAGHLIRRLHQKSAQIFAAHAQAAGVDMTPVQFAAMDTLHANPGIDQAQLAARIAYDKATIGGVIDRLERRGHVARTVSARDRRAREVRLTPAGEAAYLAFRPVVEALQDDILSGLQASERRMLLGLLAKAVAETGDGAGQADPH